MQIDTVYLCTVTGRCKPQLNGNEINRGLSSEYVQIPKSVFTSVAALLITVLMRQVEDCAIFCFGSDMHLSAIKELRDLLKELHEAT